MAASSVVEINSATAAHPIPTEEVGARLKAILEPSRVLTRAIDRIAFASDGSLYRLIPQAVVQPVDVAEVRTLFQFSQQQRVPLTFRAGGTSLSGQAITDGILVDIGRHWRAARVEENGRSIRVQPGLIGSQANQELKLYGAKIGPDPASITAARLGGILSNNASGMCCGVQQNAYHTLRSLTFLLPSGTLIDTAQPDAEATFAAAEPALAAGLLELKNKIHSNSPLASAANISAKTPLAIRSMPSSTSTHRSPSSATCSSAQKARSPSSLRLYSTLFPIFQ